MATLRCVTRLAPVSSSLIQRHLPSLTTPTSWTTTPTSIAALPYLQTRHKSHSSANRNRKWRGARKGSSGHQFSRLQTQSVVEPQIRPTRQERIVPKTPKEVEPFSTRDYGSGPSETAKRNSRRLSVMTGSATAALGAMYILYKQLTAKEEEEEEKGEGLDGADGDGKCDEESDDEEDKKKRISFHDRRVIEYENRIRAYSTPDKIFRYFATIRLKEKGEEAQIYMTPEDFLRSITPGDIQPADYGLDQFRTINMETLKKQKKKLLKVPSDSVFASLGLSGLISFSDYLFLLTILATPTRHFEIAFKMFDLNGDGEVDCEEFQTVQGVILNSTAVGARHRDHSTTGSVAGSVGDGLVEKFFGKDKDLRLTVDQFKEFHTQLLEEVMKLEFDRYDQVDGKIAELDFARLILSYASMNNQRRKKFFKRVKKIYGNSICATAVEQGGGIGFEEVTSFAKLVEGITDVEMALSMHSAAGASITADDLKTVARVVVGVELSDRLLEFIISMFDEDGDGDLSHNEFIKVMKSRTTRGLEKSKELGFSRFMGAISACLVKTARDQLGMKS